MTPPVELPQCQKLSEAETLTLWELLAAHFTLIAEQLENRIAAADGIGEGIVVEREGDGQPSGRRRRGGIRGSIGGHRGHPGSVGVVIGRW